MGSVYHRCMKRVTIQEAQTHLSRLIEEVLSGEEVIISKGCNSAVRIVPVAKRKPVRKAGGAEGMVLHIADDFDEQSDEF